MQEHLVTTKAHREVTGKTSSGNVDYRIPSIPHSAVHQQDTNRRETVKKLIQQFKNHPNKEFFLQDFNETEEIDTFSEKSKKLITDMGNTAIFELCETSSKKRCPDCASHWEIGIVYWSCGRCVIPSQSTKSWTRRTVTPYQFPVTSSKRTAPVVPNMELPSGNECYYKAKEMLQKARQPKHGGYKTILERWHNGDK